MEVRKLHAMIVCTALLALTGAAGDAADRPSYVCPRVERAPVIDGVLDDEAWNAAAPVELVLSQTGKPATKRTTARMVWDDTCLYIAFDCEDTDVWGTYTQRDDPIYREEVVEAFIDTDCDTVRYVEINVSPRNVVFDAMIVNPGDWEPSAETKFDWDVKGIRTAVHVDGTLDDRTDTDRGWSAELAIPFAGLETPAPRPGQRWRLNLYRIDLSPQPVEFQAWSPTMVSPARYHIPSRFGTVFFSESGYRPD